MKKRGFRFLPKAMKAKHELGDIVKASGIYECSVCGNYQAFKKDEHFSQCQDCINSNSEKDNTWYVTNELIYFMSKNMNLEFDNLSDFSVKIADIITEKAGTISFFFIHILWFTIWVLMNVGSFGQEHVFDPFPFGLLTMIVSLEAIFLSTFILMSQNVASKKAELRAEHEYQINLETEKNVAEILALVKDIREGNEIRAEHIEDIKETVEEISEQIDVEDEKEKATKIDEEAQEEKEFVEHEKLLDEIGIDLIPESAPPSILEDIEEQKIKEEEKILKKVKKIKREMKKRKNNLKLVKKSSKNTKSFKKNKTKKK
jgi:uncharacterized membrane protein